MQALPIIGRELRVAARHPRTWWRRVLTLLAGLGLFGFLWLDMGNRASANQLGRELFDVLGALGLVYALLAGPLLAVDCLAKERREGTLGLLFLTDLRSYDVVFGKMFATAFDMMLGVMAMMPLAAIPMLLGGIGFRDYGYLALGIFNLIFLSLSVGTLASALFVSVRAALGCTMVFLVSITFGPPLLFDAIFAQTPIRAVAEYVYMFCPGYTFYQCLGGVAWGRSTGYWLNIVGIHSLSWACLVVACWRTWRSWREPPAGALGRKWQRLLAWLMPNPARRRSLRERLLARNPVQWLESRDPLQGRLLWTTFLVTTAFWFYRHVRSLGGWPRDETLIFWALFAHWIFCAWLAIQAPRRLADDKQSGALELLLCTAIGPREIVRGGMRALALRFGWVLFAMVLLNTYAVCVYFLRHLSGSRSLASLISNDVFELAMAGAVVIPIQAYAFARVGLYQGLAQGSSLRATWHLVLKLGVLPWLLFFVVLLSFETFRRYAGWQWFPKERHILGLWAFIHVGVCGLFLLGASYQLSRNFRTLAERSRVSFWSRGKSALSPVKGR